MAQYEVNGQVHEFPDDVPPEVALSIISAANPKAFEPTPTTGNTQLDSTITQGNQMENSAEYQSPFVGTPMGIRPASQQQMLDTLGVPNDAPAEPAVEAKPQLDSSKPYGGLFTPVTPEYEQVTTDVSMDPLGSPLGTTYQQTDTVEKFIPHSELPKKPDWMKASTMIYQALEKKPFEGTPEELADYGAGLAQFFNNNLTLGGIPLALTVSQLPEEDRQAFLYLIDTYDHVGGTPGTAARAFAYQATDPANLVGIASVLSTLGLDTAAVAGAKQGFKMLLKKLVLNPATIGGLDAAIVGGARNVTDQSVEVSGGRQDSIDLGQVLEAAGLTGLVGAGLGGGAGIVSKMLAKEATPKVEMPKVTVDFMPPPQTNPELENVVSQFEMRLKEELAKDSLSPELQDVVNQIGDNMAAALDGAETLDQKAQKVLEQFAPSHADVAAANDNGGRVLDVTNDNYKNPANNDNSILVDNDNSAKVVASTTDRIDMIKDQIGGIGIDERKVLNENNPPKPQVSDGVKELLDRVPDFEEYSMDYVRKAIKPVMDEFLEIAKQGPEELDRAISYKLVDTERTKLMAIVTSAADRTERAVREVEDQLSILVGQPEPNARQIDALESKRTELLDQLKNIQVLQSPVSKEAGRLLKLAQIENALNAENRVDVAKLKAMGVADEDIARMIADASDSVSKKELYSLYRQRDEAMKLQDREEMAKLDAKIDDTLEKLKKATEVAKDGWLKKTIGVLVELRTTSLISSTGTVTRNLVGGGLHKILDRSAEIAGLFWTQKDAYQYIMAQRIGREIAFRAGFRSQLEALQHLFTNSVKEAVNERSLLDIGDLGDRNVRKISSTALGLDPKSATGKTVDVAGRIWRAQTIPMLITDEMMGGVFARAEIGEQAGFEFVQLIAKKREVINAKLRDPSLKPKQRAKYEAELEGYKDIKKAIVNGKSLEQFIEQRVKSAIDKTGRITDEAVRERVNYLLLRNAPTGEISKGLEHIANMGGGAARLLQPFVRNPINDFKRTLEYIPITQNLKFMHDLGTDLASKDPRVVARAKGKFIVGWTIMATMLYAAYEGLSTGSAPKNKDDRLTNEASGIMAPKSFNMFGYETDVSGLGPLGNISIFASNFVNDSERQWRDIENLKAIGDEEGAAQKMTEFEEFKKKGMAVAYAYLAGLANSTMDTNTLEGQKSLIDAAVTLQSTVDSNETFGKSAQKQGEKYAVSFVPAFLKEASNVVDPTKVDPNGVIEALKASVGIKKDQAVIRDALGYPIENKTPYRALIGPFGPQNIKEADNKVQIVRNNLEYLRQMTGKSFILDATPPEVQKFDLTKIRAKNSGRTMYDAYAENLQNIRLAGTGGRSQTLADALYEVIGNKDVLQRSIGNAKNPGTLFADITKVINRYKEVAWFKTKNDEKTNQEFVQKFNWQLQLEKASKDPRLDIAPPSIQLPFK